MFLIVKFFRIFWDTMSIFYKSLPFLVSPITLFVVAKLQELKRKLIFAFEMKNIGPTKKILGMSIVRERDKGKLRIHQWGYLVKFVSKFSIGDAKLVNVPLASHF